MRVTIIGTGNLARGIATRALAGGHHVSFVGTHVSKAQDLADELAGLGTVRASETAEGDVVVIAVPYSGAAHVVRQHAGELGQAVLVDPTNPVDLSTFEPIEVELGSAAQVIASIAPEGVQVVKAFNTTFAGILIGGEVAGQPLDVFLAGDGAEAKELVSRVVRDGGMRAIDAGPLARARELEALGYLHMAVQPGLGTQYASAVKILA
jgi:hypothetical protein